MVERGGGARPVLLDDATVAALLPARPARAHKGTFGRLLVVAGSLDHLGAALLTAGGATRSGAGLVTLAVPASLQSLVAGRLLEVVTLGLPETGPGVVDAPGAARLLATRSADALVVGPGLRPGEASEALVGALLAPRGAAAPPAVVDAEALNGLARVPRWWTAVRRPAVLTPHPGEFARLAGAGQGRRVRGEAAAGDDEERASAGAAAAAAWRQVVVLKGARTVIASPLGDVAVAPFENPALATAGSGDVLAGAIGALLAQGLAPWDAARLGVYLHGLAGEAVREALGDAGAVATDLLGQLPPARRRLAALASGRRPVGFASASGTGP